MQENPRTIKLLFQPAGLGARNDPFTLSHKVNQCVRCGRTNGLTKHHVVPSCYRKHLLECHKDYNMHDVLLMCTDCHEEYERHAAILKARLADEYDAPINGRYDTPPRAARLASAITKHSDRIPPDRRQSIICELNALVGPLAEGDIERLSRCSRNCAVSHGEIVISAIPDADQQQEFIQMWRRHFVAHVEPKYLPPNWSVERRPRDEDCIPRRDKADEDAT